MKGRYAYEFCSCRQIILPGIGYSSEESYDGTVCLKGLQLLTMRFYLIYRCQRPYDWAVRPSVSQTEIPT